METKEFLFLLFGVQTFVISGILFFYRSEKYKLNRYLGFFFLTLLVEIVLRFIYRGDTIHPSIYYVPFRFNLLSMNFLFLYAAETSGKQLNNKWKTYIPAFIEFGVFSVLFTLVLINPEIHEHLKTSFFWNIASLISALYIISISILIIKVVIYHRNMLSKFYTKTRFKSMLWLGVFSMLCIVFNIFAYFKLNYLKNDSLALVFDIIYLVSMYYITIASLVQINIINSIQVKDTDEDTNNLQKIYAVVKRHMEVDKAYLDPNINLRKIANSVDLPQRNISKAINAIENKNLNTFINSYRIEEFKKLLQSDKHQKYSISAIADEVGFNSRASFYKNFKDIVGESPTAYVKNIDN